jgi:hypothetical protein
MECQCEEVKYCEHCGAPICPVCGKYKEPAKVVVWSIDHGKLEVQRYMVPPWPIAPGLKPWPMVGD